MFVDENSLHYLRRRKVFYHKFQRDKKKTQTKEVKLIEATFDSQKKIIIIKK